MQFVAVQLKRIFGAGFVSLAVISMSSVSLAVKVEQVPNSRQINGGWVTDMADVLSPSTEAQLNQMISQLEAKNGSEIAVVTVPETSPSATPKLFATTLFNRWGIGKAGNNNGVLLLISTGDRRVEIETGYGVETILPNSFVGTIIRQEISPRFKRGDYDGGTLAGTKALVVTLEAYNPPANLNLNESSSAQIAWYSWIPIAASARGVVIFVLLIAAPIIIVFWIVRSISRAISGSKSRLGSRGSSSSTGGSSYSSSSSNYDINSSYSSDDNTYVIYDNNSSYSSSSSDGSDRSIGSSSESSDRSYSSDNSSSESDRSYSSDSSSYDSGSSSSSDSSSSDSSSSSSSDSSSFDSSSSSSYDSSSSSSSSYDSSSSSSDFGGGSSGGGGGGDNW